MRNDPAGPTVILSPHLDDAVLSTWSVLRRPGDVTVVNVCTGLPPAGTEGFWDRITGMTDSVAVMGARLAEDREALALAGREPVGLGFLDAQYRAEELDQAELREAFEREVPLASALFAPANIARHPDHLATRTLALGVAADSGVALHLYAELPYSSRFGWPHWVTGEPADPKLLPAEVWEGALNDLPMDRERLEPQPIRLPDDEAARKLDAMRTYATQFTALQGGPHEMLSHPSVLPFEVTWAVH
jgi:LmbE family N-acetylglucosaminyl deacetylase